MVVAEEIATERVGQFTFTVTRGEDSPESRERWSRRSDALAAWLLAEWQRERGDQRYPMTAREMAERN